MPVKVAIPSARQDRPRVAALALLGAVGVSLGVGLARWGAGQGPPSGQTRPSPAEAAATSPAPAEGALAQGGTDAEAPRSPEPEGPPPGAPGAAPAEPALEVPTATPTPTATATPTDPGAARPGGPRHVEQGRVAYLRCDGVPPSTGPFPCPRDPGLERAVWHAIDEMASCDGLGGELGEADLSLTLVRGAPTEIGTRDTFRSDVSRLDPTRVMGCLRAPLAGVTPTLDASRLVVSFRFRVR